MKHTRWARFFETLIFTILLTLPILNVFVRSIYVQNNDNAKDSYYGETINETENVYLESNSQLLLNDNALYMNNSYFIDTTLSGTITYQSVSLDSGYSSSISQENLDIISASRRLYFYRGTSITFYDDVNNTSYLMVMPTIVLKFVNITSIPSIDTIYHAFFYLKYNKYSYLDNVFEYSLSKTIDDFGSGNINFVNWLGNLMFDNVRTNLYFNFVNMWFNYSLVICVAHFLWYVFYWFIKQGRELIYSFSIKEKE